MPPNPTWGWKLEGDSYKIDPKLKELNNFVNRLLLVDTDNKEQQEAILDIMKLRLEIGKLAINTQKQGKEGISEDIALKSTFLKFKIGSYTEKYGKNSPERESYKEVDVPGWLERQRKSIGESISKNRKASARRSNSSEDISQAPKRPKKLDHEELRRKFARQSSRRGASPNIRTRGA